MKKCETCAMSDLRGDSLECTLYLPMTNDCIEYILHDYFEAELTKESEVE